ncbi:MAG: hypothetical protein AB1568_14485 [Thermodesulfobacteriota bacterium]
MRLLRARVLGHFAVNNSGWFSCSPELTLIVGAAGAGKSTVLRALRSINPPFFEPEPTPFADYPRMVEQGGRQRRVIASKKTAVVTVFACDEPLRAELARIDPVFLETERIEIGRRLDGSRWLTFVEIASSSRWSEVDADMSRLREALGGAGIAEIDEGFAFCATLLPTDRIKGATAARLDRLLSRLDRVAAAADLRGLIARIRHAVSRAERFGKARRLVLRHLPVMLFLRADSLLQTVLDPQGLRGQPPALGEWARPGGDLLFLDLLGIRPGQARWNKAAAGEDHLDRLCDRLTSLLREWLPHRRLRLAARRLQGQVEFAVEGNGNPPVPLDRLPAHLRWLITCAVGVLWSEGRRGGPVVFLLDEPDAGCSEAEAGELSAALPALCDTGHQCVLATTRVSAVREGGRGYLLANEDGGQGSTMHPLSA